MYTPIYRAEVLGKKNSFAIGFYSYDECHNRHLIITNDLHGLNECRVDKTTLSMHFPDMLAKNSDRLLPNGKEDLRIFASLSEDGKGGDVVDLPKWLKVDESVERKALIVCSGFNRYRAIALENGTEYGSGHFIECSKIIGIK